MRESAGGMKAFRRWLAIGLGGLAIVVGLAFLDDPLERLRSVVASALEATSTDLSGAQRSVADYASQIDPGIATGWQTKASVLPVSTLVARYVEGYDLQEGYVGRVTSRRSSDLGFDRSGRVAAIMIDEGTQVRKGQPLAELASELLQAQKEILQAQLAHTQAEFLEANARLSLAQSTRQRHRQLVSTRNLSQQVYDESAFEEAAAEARVTAVGARIREVRLSIDKVDLEMSLSTIYAPWDGTIAGRFVSEGTTVNPGTPVLRILESGAFQVRAGIPVTAADEFEIGRSYRIEVDGNVIEAPLVAVLPELDGRTGTVPVVFGLPNVSKVHVGQMARITIGRWVPVRGSWIPITALVEGRRGLWTAYALEQSKKGEGLFHLKPRDLTMISLTANEAFVTGTVADGELLVATGLHRLVLGQLVRVQ